MKRLFLSIVLAFACLSCHADSSTFRLLVFSEAADFYHDSIPAGVQALQSLGVEHGFDVDAATDSSVFNAEDLARYRVVIFFNTTGDVLNPDEQASLENFIRSGGGFVGIHSAADTEHDWPWYGGLIGTYFANHPEIQSATATIIEPDHPSTGALPQQWTRVDEWYNFREDPSPGVEVLITLDESTYSGGEMGSHHPISWQHQYDGGRAWYTAMGHTPESYMDPLFLSHILGGIQWAAVMPA